MEKERQAEQLTQRNSTLEMELEMKSRNLEELDFRLKKEEMQREMREDALVSLRDQNKKITKIFKEESERLRHEMLSKME